MRCGRQVSVDDPSFVYGEATSRGGFVCEGCVTPAEQQSTDEETMTLGDKVRENRLRRMADRQGLRLEKSRRRDPSALDFGTYGIVDARTNAVVAHGGNVFNGYGLSLDDVEEYLTR